MRRKVSREQEPPRKYVRYKPSEWPGGWCQFVAERESWNASQPAVRYSGSTPAGLNWSGECGPLGDAVDLFRARREARMIDADR